ncbi:MAG: DUF2313 domain-containing protein [Bacillota bacterium]|nr:DUF2313 domain-containing protein [Bacillota bacterium]
MIINYLPPVLKDIREMAAVMDSEQGEIESLWNDLGVAMDDQFVADASENGVKRWEKLLQITPKADDSLDVRKFKILSRLTEQAPFTKTNLRQQLDALCGADGYTVEIKGSQYLVTVRVALTVQKKFDEVAALLKRIVPANLLVDVSLKYNQHMNFTKLTHSQMAQYTHYELRNSEELGA